MKAQELAELFFAIIKQLQTIETKFFNVNLSFSMKIESVTFDGGAGFNVKICKRDC